MVAATQKPSRVTSSRGTLEVALAAPGVFVGIIEGHYGRDLLDAYMNGMASALRAPPMIFFHSWWGMTSYDSICRKTMTDWAVKYRAETAGHHVLLRSKLVAMGVATAGMIIGGNMVVSYNNSAKYEPLIERAVAEKTRPGA